jgi:hypothetical protein
LFGSRGQGSSTEESDFGFLVLKADVANELHLAQKIYLDLLILPADASVDILVEGLRLPSLPAAAANTR